MIHVRNVGGAVVGWVVMAGAVFLLFGPLRMVLGVDGAFQPQSWEVSGMWLLGSIVVSLLAAVFGGLVCTWVAADDRGLLMLMVLVVVLGITNALGRCPLGGRRPATGCEHDGGDEIRAAAEVAGVAQPRARSRGCLRRFTTREEPIASRSHARLAGFRATP